jgi:hypothetical protein
VGVDGNEYAVIETFAHGGWAVTPAPEPANAIPHRFSTLFSVSCTSPTTCVAAGTYMGMANLDEPFVDTLAGGTWTATALPLPAGWATAHLNAVSCATATFCVAVGYGAGGLIETLSSGRWTATAAPEPPDSGHALTFFRSVSCPAPHACTAVGAYEGTDNGRRALIEVLSHRGWSPLRAPLPPDALGGGGDLFSVSCGTRRSCATVGTYLDPARNDVGLIDTLADGEWTATRAPEPPDAGTDGGTIPTTSLNSVSCGARGSCTAVGTYRLLSFAPFLVPNSGWIVNLSKGTWTATKAPEPPDASTSPVSSHTELDSVSCRSARACTTVGSYIDTNLHHRGLIDTRATTTWSPLAAPEPADSDTTGASLRSVACRHDTCAAAGTYTNTTGSPQGLLETISPPGR